MGVALGYVRVSTDRQDLSVEAQTTAIKRAAEYHKLPLHELFAEPDTSGSKPFAERESGRRLLGLIHQLKVTHQLTLLVPKVDRLGRDSVDVNQTVRLLDSLDVRVVFLDINVDTRTAMGKAFMQIAAVFAELELARIRERIQAALDQKRSAGQCLGTLPYGWDARETGGVTAKGVKIKELIPNQTEQKWILQMDAWRKAGWSYNRIAKELNSQSVPTKTGAGNVIRYKGAVQFSRGKWHEGKVQKVLTNKTTREWLESRQAGTDRLSAVNLAAAA